MFFGELLEPILETFGVLLIFLGVSLGYLSWNNLLVIFLLTWGITLSLTFISIALEITTFRRYTKVSQIAKLVLYSLSENFVLRPVYLIWRFIGIHRYFSKKQIW